MLRASLAGGVAAWTTWEWNAARAAALDHVLRDTAGPAGTTLVETIVRSGGDGYLSLRSGPGWPTLARADLAPAPTSGRRERVALAAFVHLTDVHVIDAQSTGRVEFLDDVSSVFSAAFRPQELLTTQVQSSMVERIRRLRNGPITGRRFDCAVSTGDNIDNQQHNELAWFMRVLDGGSVRPNSGAPTDYEGVQLTEWGDERYWHPDAPRTDRYGRDHGFPEIDGFLAAAIRGFDAPGLDIPWYSTYGNHDGLVQGNLARSEAIDQILTGDLKLTGTGRTSFTTLLGIITSDASAVRDRVRRGDLDARTVTPDPQRRTVTTSEWVEAHLAPTDGPGPVGHGYTRDHLDGSALFYRFDISSAVVGISLDTGGFNSGSIGASQLAWLDAQLRSVTSRWYDTDGSEQRSTVDDRLVVVFSHFPSPTLTGSVDPTRPTERRVQGPELLATLHRFPNVVAWVNGHTHSNVIEPRPAPAGRSGGFWEITTASHVDYPEQARVIEVTDNGDGTVSIFTTMVEHAAPARADHGDLSALGLASISRELSANNSVDDIDRHVGSITALNCELVLPAPFPLRTLAAEAATTTAAVTTTAAPGATASAPSGTSPGGHGAVSDDAAVGGLVGGLGIGAAALALGAAHSLRRRRSSDDARTDARDDTSAH